MSGISLNDDHELQVQGYLRFAKLKRDQHVREVTSVVRDFKDDKIRPGEMYNFQELDSIFSDLMDEVNSLADKEIQNAYHANALLVKILLSQAQVQGLSLLVDTNQLENEFLLKQIAASETTALSRPASDFVRRNNALNKIGTVASVAVQDPELIKERDSLKAELAATKERLAKLQEQTTAMMRDKTALQEQVTSLRDQLGLKDSALDAAGRDKLAAVSGVRAEMQALALSAAGAEAGKAATAQVAALQNELEHLKGDLAAALNKAKLKEAEAAQAAEAVNGKLQDSKQYQQMKQLMQTKSQEVVTLRKRLAKYEPQSVADGDA